MYRYAVVLARPGTFDFTNAQALGIYDDFDEACDHARYVDGAAVIPGRACPGEENHDG